ncbi:MAG: DUF805 domain-containing protein [Muribaculaceae bacterium]|nr:DUF805 domain-containing protein [Bacteroides sp.]MDE6803334.1 DUF805 domain-containing protein [Muribaculaceae bacterium]MDE6843467.1 DUF805 domain-containing protein [Muribaculaceae bacterium]
MVTFTSAIRDFYSKYIDFSGRANRAQYWWVALYILIVEGVCSAFMGAAGEGFWANLWYGVLGLFCLVNILPGLGLSVRRLHDTGRGGGWIFINLVPLIGSIWFLVLMLLPSQGSNRFGQPVGRY